MLPSLLLVTGIFVAFLAFLAAIGFAAYRFAANRDGQSLGAAGGCALAAVLLGAAFLGLVGFAIVIGVLVARRAAQSGEFERWRESIHQELKRFPESHEFHRTPSVERDVEQHGADTTGHHDDIRKY